MKLFMKIGFVGTLASMFSVGLASENDLGLYETAQISAEVTTHQGQNGVEVLLSASHPYTNTLGCSVTLILPAKRAGRNFLKHVPAGNLRVFPENAWGPVSIPVPVILSSGETLVAGQSQIVTLTCSGYDNRDVLPREYCQRPEAFAGHSETCRMLTEMYGQGAAYPVIISGDYVGSCRCD